MSSAENLGGVSFPPFAWIRVLMMPFDLGAIRDSMPPMLQRWAHAVADVADRGGCKTGVAYLTIDERYVPGGAAHRRPGLHVDGWGDDAGGGWGGGGWGKSGWLTASSHVGCAVWDQDFDGEPKRYGDCEHMRFQCDVRAMRVLEPAHLYMMDSMAVHESIPTPRQVYRQFLRLSLPSDAGWPESNTRNPTGVEPTGRILPARPHAFSSYVPVSP